MGRRPVGDLWGVGPRTVKKLDELVWSGPGGG
jgi:nucleotidyltransferase/DNA polymerase involved in DNA repair